MANTKKFNKSNPYFRELTGYKAINHQIAIVKGIESKFMAAPTITEARKILYGIKIKRFTCCVSGKCCQCAKWFMSKFVKIGPGRYNLDEILHYYPYDNDAYNNHTIEFISINGKGMNENFTNKTDRDKALVTLDGYLLNSPVSN